MTDYTNEPPSYTRDPAFALPLIERECIQSWKLAEGEWRVKINPPAWPASGPTLAIAVCKAIVARSES